MSHFPKKRFGQHFLMDNSVLLRITRELQLQKNDCVIEIGPGLGALTAYLLSALDHLTVIELDRDLIDTLKKNFDPQKINIINQDALTVDFQQCTTSEKTLRVVGNLPYNISTELLFHLFSTIHLIRDMHFMLQKEVVVRITAPPGDTHYSRLSVMTQYFCDADLLFFVSSDAFDPPPAVESAMIRLTPKSHFPLSEKDYLIFSDIVKEAFTYRRKTIQNGLKRYVSAADWATLKINPQLRPQDLSVSDYIRIAQAISIG